MKLHLFTLVLDGMPFIQWTHETLQSLSIPWRWVVVHGASMNGGSTRWCQQQQPRLGNDGTTEFLSAIQDDRVQIIQQESWPSKDEMCRSALVSLGSETVLFQLDADEIHTKANIEKIVSLFENDNSIGAIRMPCRYFVGSNLVCSGDNCWSNWKTEWERAWRANKDTVMLEHEPPKLNRILGRVMEREEAASHGLTFDHLSYARREQVIFKEAFYGYDGVLNQWDALQRNTVWPAKLSRFFSFVSGDRPLVRKIG